MAFGLRSSVFSLWSLVFGLLLSGCMLSSGERVSQDTRPEAGNRSASFVSANGDSTESLEIGVPDATLRVIVLLEAEQGELQLDVLDAGNAVALSTRSQPGDQVTRSGLVSTGPDGVLRYRVVARGARNGGYQILYQQQ